MPPSNVAIHNMKCIIFAVSLLACCASLYPISTFIMFAEMRKKRFMKFIFFMSCCDFFVSIASLIGFPHSGHPLCTVQGIILIYFSTASWFWTTCLSFCIYRIITDGSIRTPDWIFHVICWGLPLLLCLLPLTNAQYAAAPDGLHWCLITNTSKSPPDAAEIWSYLAFFCWLFFCAALMSLWYFRIRTRIYGKSDSLSMFVLRTHDRISLYPIAMLCSWLVNFVFVEFFVDSQSFISALSMLFGVSYGTLTAIIFYIKSDEARCRWYEVLKTSTCLFRVLNTERVTGDIPIDFEDEEITNPFVQSDLFSGHPTTNIIRTSDNTILSNSNSLAIRPVSTLSIPRLTMIESVQATNASLPSNGGPIAKSTGSTIRGSMLSKVDSIHHDI